MITVKQLGKLIRFARKDKFITQQGLCKKLKLTQGTLSKVENWQLELGFRPFLKVCEILGFDPSAVEDEFEYFKIKAKE